MKRFRQGEKNHVDPDKVRKKTEIKKMILEILEYSANEDDFVKVVKSVNPKIEPAELQELIALFHQSVREKRGVL